MRDLPTVIDAMLAHIPEDKAHLRSMLLGCKESCFFTAPEAMSYRWSQAAADLITELGPHPHAEPWQISVCDAWTGKADK